MIAFPPDIHGFLQRVEGFIPGGEIGSVGIFGQRTVVKEKAEGRISCRNLTQPSVFRWMTLEIRHHAQQIMAALADWG